mgnify:CR=1 FL=1
MAHYRAVRDDRLGVVEERLGILQLELDQSSRQPVSLSIQHGLASNEVAECGPRLVELHGEAEACLENVILGRNDDTPSRASASPSH